MKLSEFISEHRVELIADWQESLLLNTVPNEDEIESWILNSEGLYNWALQNGVSDI